MSLQQVQMIAWIATICSCIIAAIANRNHLKEFFDKWKWGFIGVFILLGISEGCLRGWFVWLIHPVTWPVWALILLGFLSLIIPLGIILIFVFLEKQPLQSQQSNLYNYVTDVIYGVEWLWGYAGTKLDENQLSAFCPNQKCKCRLEPQTNHNVRNYRGMNFPISFVCEHCGFRQDFDFDMDDIKRKVFVEIERRIRTGEFQQRLTRNDT